MDWGKNQLQVTTKGTTKTVLLYGKELDLNGLILRVLLRLGISVKNK